MLDTADDAALPGAFRVVLDALVRGGGTVLLGGTPFRLVRLSPAEAAAVRRWQAGEAVGGAPADRALARALVAANLAQPVPPAGVGATAADAVTVVVPVRDHAAALRRLLAALAADAAVAAVVVVDDGSRDPAAVAAVAAASGARLVARPSSGGPGAARNAGAALAGTPLVAFVDADCVPAPGWLDALLPHFADPRVALVAPRIVAADEDGGPLTRYEAVRAPHDRGPAPARVVPGGRVPFVPGAALVARAAALGAGFDPALRGGEDVDLVWRLTAAGHHVRYEPAARVAHAHRTAPRDWLARRVSYGAGAAPLARRHPGAARPLALSPWSAAAWLAVALGRPAIGAGITGAAAGLLARELRGTVERPAGLAVRLAGLGTLRSGRVVADALVRTWWPAGAAGALRSTRLRRVMAAAALAGPLLDHRSQRPPLDPVRWTALRLLDDAAYGWGVWFGCLRARTPDPLLPDLSWRMRSCTGAELVRAGDTVARCQTFR